MMLQDERILLFGLMFLQWLLLIIVLVWMLIINSRSKKILKQFRELTNGVTKENLEAILRKFLDQTKEVRESHQEVKQEMTDLKKAVGRKKGNVGVYRFHAFDHEGSDLSFSIAVIDDIETGFVLTSIFGRQESRVYAKPLDRGKSVYHLTSEEIEAIERAKKSLS
ncbi:hypothetical protein J2Z37_000617 [Ammoniphilus resinae]|uniref:DUF4446 family protein n=2 Tax=Ammoniphilus resinae TaxID=861532 RepID=A0ABS4GK42_9BACL|nr:hypothetical protein [Ammoniphilus resinae]